MPPLSMEGWVKETLGIDPVPTLYVGPVDDKIIEEYTSGNETVSGTSANIREGIVIKPLMPRLDDEIGRVVQLLPGYILL